MRRVIVPASLILLGAAIGAIGTQGQVATAASGILNVLVTNSSSHPVATQDQNVDTNGNIKVHEQGIANVDVTNTMLPVHELGTALVSVANMPGSQPFMRNESVVLEPGQTFASTCDSVPKGKSFAMEFIDLQTNGLASGEVLYVTLDVSTGTAFVSHPLPLQATAGDVPMFASPVRLYADPGSDFCLSVHRLGDTAESIRADYSVTGYLISS